MGGGYKTVGGGGDKSSFTPSKRGGRNRFRHWFWGTFNTGA